MFAGNTYLSNWCKQFTENVHEVPTAVNLSKFKEKQREMRVDVRDANPKEEYINKITGKEST